MDISELLIPSVQIALIIGIAEAIKKAGIPAKWIPVVDIVLGMISGICVYGLYMGQGITSGILMGVYLGLSACGLFSGVKNIIEPRYIPEEEEEAIDLDMGLTDDEDLRD